MSKKKNKKIKGNKVDEFRKLHNTDSKGHTAYIYSKVGGNFEFIGITHGPITKGVKNIKLDKNPDPSDKSQAYIKPKSDKENRRKFGKALNNWKFADSDKVKVNDVIRKSKK